MKPEEAQTGFSGPFKIACTLTTSLQFSAVACQPLSSANQRRLRSLAAPGSFVALRLRVRSLGCEGVTWLTCRTPACPRGALGWCLTPGLRERLGVNEVVINQGWGFLYSIKAN